MHGESCSRCAVWSSFHSTPDICSSYRSAEEPDRAIEDVYHLEAVCIFEEKKSTQAACGERGERSGIWETFLLCTALSMPDVECRYGNRQS